MWSTDKSTNDVLQHLRTSESRTRIVVQGITSARSYNIRWRNRRTGVKQVIATWIKYHALFIKVLVCSNDVFKPLKVRLGTKAALKHRILCSHDTAKGSVHLALLFRNRFQIASVEVWTRQRRFATFLCRFHKLAFSFMFFLWCIFQLWTS